MTADIYTERLDHFENGEQLLIYLAMKRSRQLSGHLVCVCRPLGLACNTASCGVTFLLLAYESGRECSWAINYDPNCSNDRHRWCPMYSTNVCQCQWNSNTWYSNLKKKHTNRFDIFCFWLIELNKARASRLINAFTYQNDFWIWAGFSGPPAYYSLLMKWHPSLSIA